MFTAILAVFLVVFSALICYLVLDRISFKRAAIFDVRDLIAYYEKRIANIKSIENDLAGTETDWQEINQALFNKDVTVVNFIEELEFLAKKTGAQLKTNSIRLSQEEGEAAEFQINLSGSFAEIFHYIFLLERDPFWAGVQRINLQKTGKENIWSSDINLRLLNLQ